MAVVLTNQMTTRILAEGRSELVPALGESWGHHPANRVRLWPADDNGERKARLFKSASCPKRTAAYRITKAGVRDVKVDKAKRGASDGRTPGPATKRARVP